MSEPIYEYRKGEGWIAFAGNFLTYKGRRYQFENRLPAYGEKYLFCDYAYTDRFEKDGKTLKFDFYANRKENLLAVKTRYIGHVFAKGGGYATLVPVE